MMDVGQPRLERVMQSRSRLFREAFAIYAAAIPRSEQKTRAQIVAGLKNPQVEMWAFLRGPDVAGLSILYASCRNDLRLLEYLAVLPGLQGQGLGSDLFLASLGAGAERPLLIEVDSELEDVPDAERAVRIKRKKFYRRLGCREIAGFDYILPLETYGPAPRMSLMVRGGPECIDAARLRAALEEIYVEVYGCAPSDPRLARMFAQSGARFDLV